MKIRTKQTGISLIELLIGLAISFVVISGVTQTYVSIIQSAGNTEFRRAIQLTGGRAYPLTVDFYQRKRKTRQPPARLSLSWITPTHLNRLVVVCSHRVLVEVLPDFRNLNRLLESPPLLISRILTPT